jgi:hypothetical protein
MIFLFIKIYYTQRIAVSLFLKTVVSPYPYRGQLYRCNLDSVFSCVSFLMILVEIGPFDPEIRITDVLIHLCGMFV